MKELVVTIEQRDGVSVVSSRVVAEQLGKRHADVLEAIRKVVTETSTAKLFAESTYVNRGKEYPEILMTKDGFTLYMFNIVGYNEFKMAYISKFNEMESFIKNNTPQLSQEQQLVLSVYAGGVEAVNATKALVELKTKPLVEVIEKQAPKVEYHDKVLNNDNLLTITSIAKDIGISGKALNTKLNEAKIQYKQGKTWHLYAKHENKVPEYADYISTEYGMSLKWTEKGRKWLLELFGNGDI